VILAATGGCWNKRVGLVDVGVDGKKEIVVGV
jgi:hypothetical protein